MSEVQYTAHPSPLRIRPFAQLSMVAILLFGLLLVIVGRYQWPSILGGLAPGLEQIDGQIVQYIGVALFGLAMAILYLWYVPTRFERLGITDDALIYHKGSLTKSKLEDRAELGARSEDRPNPVAAAGERRRHRGLHRRG